MNIKDFKNNSFNKDDIYDCAIWSFINQISKNEELLIMNVDEEKPMAKKRLFILRIF